METRVSKYTIVLSRNDRAGFGIRSGCDRSRNERNETVKWFLHVSTEIDKRDSLRRFPDNYVPLVR